MSQSGVELEQMLAKRDGEIVRLREEVQRLQLTLQDVQQNTANHISRLHQQLTSKMENIERLEAKLNSQQDYEKIKEELRILKEKRGALGQFNPRSSSSPISDSTVLDTEEILSQRPCAEDRADQNITGVKIKREAETPPEVHPSIELVERLSTLADISCGLTESSRKITPSPCLSPRDHLPYAYIETKNISGDCSFRADTCRTGGNGNTWASWSVNHDILEGSFMEGLENQIETAEIAQRVKDLLHKYKIGQRVFGYYVLDRLQGSVSEILAHPKPWDKLTTRGKEPFLRMIHFLSDGQNVLALRMIQDRLRAASPSSNVLGSSSPVHSSEKSADDVIRNILEQAKKEFRSQNRGNETRIQQGPSKCSATHDDNSTGRGTEDIIKSILEQARLDMKVQQDSKGQNKGRVGDLLKTSETDKGKNLDQDSSNFVQKIIRKVKSEIVSETTFSASEIPTLLPAQSSTNPSSIAPLPFSDANHNNSLSRKQDKVLSPHPGGEMHFTRTKIHPEDLAGKLIHPIHLALEGYKENWHPPHSKDGQRYAGSYSYHSGLDAQQLKFQSLQLDTQIITRRVKEILAENRLGQRLFGEHVLGLTQGSVSDLLSWPKPWSELSTKGKEPFLRMYFWLKDPQNVDHLKALKSTGQRAHGKRPFSPLSTSQEAFQDRTLTGLSSVDHPGWLDMAKRARVVLTFEEKAILRRTFQLDPYPSQQTIQTLALQLDLRPSTVTNWFSNHRSRLKRPFQDGSSVVTNHSNSPLPDTETETQHHCSDPNPCSYSSPPCMDSLMTVKQEPSEAEISEMSGEETDIHWDAKYVSTGVQSSRDLKIEEEEGRIILSPQPKEGYWLDKMVKDDPDMADQDSRMFSAKQNGDSIDLMTTSLNSTGIHHHTAV